jgi:Zn/Cd-binding protein ZinT
MRTGKASLGVTHMYKMQGRDEKRTKLYMKYSDGSIADCDAADYHEHQRVAGSAGEQAGVVWKP